MTDFLSSLKIAATGLHAQNARMRIIAENLANADSAGKTPGADPYRRRLPTFQAVMDSDAGGEIVKAGHATAWGGYSSYFRDPDGHLWEVAWNPAWEQPDSGP